MVSFVNKNNCENPSSFFFIEFLFFFCFCFCLNGLIVMGDLPGEKKIQRNGLIVMGDLLK